MALSIASVLSLSVALRREVPQSWDEPTAWDAPDQSALAQAKPRGLVPDKYIFSNRTDNANTLRLMMRGGQATALCHIQNGCWPRLYLLGAQKAATTSVFQLLERRGMVCGARYEPDKDMFEARNYFSTKEPHAFDAEDQGERGFSQLKRDPARYTRMFREDQCVSGEFMDATPLLQNVWAPIRMQAIIPSSWLPRMRFIAILREPIARELSWYNHRLLEDGTENFLGSHFCAASKEGVAKGEGPTFEAETLCSMQKWNSCFGKANMPSGFFDPSVDEVRMRREYLRCMWSSMDHGDMQYGLYAMHYYQWTQAFSAEQIMLWEFDHLLDAVGYHINAAINFLGLPPLADGVVNSLRMRSANDHGSRDKVETIECKTYERLRAFFQPWNAMLYHYLSQDQEAAAANAILLPRFVSRTRCSNEAQQPPAMLNARRRHNQERTTSLAANTSAALDIAALSEASAVGAQRPSPPMRWLGDPSARR